MASDDEKAKSEEGSGGSIGLPRFMLSGVSVKKTCTHPKAGQLNAFELMFSILGVNLTT